MVSPPESVSGQDGTIGTPELQGVLVDRGVGFQAVGFTVVFIGSVAILETFEGSNLWLYQWLERATVDIYWASLIPLAALFDWMRKMFERGKAIREAKKREILERVRQKVRQDETRRIQKLLKSPGVVLPPEIAAAIFDDTPENGA